MNQVLLYMHNRMFVERRDREEIMAVLVKKMIKSVARSVGNRIGQNKWGQVLTFLTSTVGFDQGVQHPDMEWLDESFNRHLSQYITTSKTTVLRCQLMWKYIIREYKNKTALEVFGSMQDDFEDDKEFFKEFALKIGLRIAGCGHLADRSTTVHMHHVDNGVGRLESMCRHCFDPQASNYGFSDYIGGYVPTEHYVLVHGAGQEYYSDRRLAGITFNERYNRYVDRTWSPYANLIDGYHSSKQRGFSIIDSPWFRQHRRAFGMELEIQVRDGNTNAAAGRMHEALNPNGNVGEYCYFERDGSIGEGFEIVTQPAGLDIHRSKMATVLNSPDIKRGMRSHEGGSCGLHIHVGRQYVTQAQIYRIQAFLNDVRNEGIVRKIARRYGTNYARVDPRLSKLSPEGKHTGERYEALNVTNRDTIEFRIFRGSLRYESVMAALEFVNSLLDFCMPGQTSIMDFNAIGFRKFLAQPTNRADTEFLRPYLSINTSTDNEQLVA